MTKANWSILLKSKVERRLVITGDSWGSQEFQIRGEVPKTIYRKISRLKNLQVQTLPGKKIEKVALLLNEYRVPTYTGYLSDPELKLSEVALGGEYVVYARLATRLVVSKAYRDAILSIYPNAVPLILPSKLGQFSNPPTIEISGDPVLFLRGKTVIGAIAPIICGKGGRILFTTIVKEVRLKKTLRDNPTFVNVYKKQDKEVALWI